MTTSGPLNHLFLYLGPLFSKPVSWLGLFLPFLTANWQVDSLDPTANPNSLFNNVLTSQVLFDRNRQTNKQPRFVLIGGGNRKKIAYSLSHLVCAC